MNHSADLPHNPDASPGALDADIVRALDEAQRPADVDVDAAMAARVRSRVMGRIAAEATQGHVTIAADQPSWRDFLPGIACKVLHTSGETMSYLLRFAPGAVLPAHHHPVDEECVVLQGELRIGANLTVAQGGFHMARAGVPHDAITSDAGCVIYLRGARPRLEHQL